MEEKDILKLIDHTLLQADATWEQIVALCDEAVKYGTATVCIPQTYLKRVHDKYGDSLKLCTVIGFPLGYNSASSKVVEAKDSIADGAEEIDTVVNISDVKNHRYDEVRKELKMIREACGDKLLKVIIETCYLTEEEKIELCKIVTEAKADYIKTSTGFGSAGATLEDIELFKKHIGPDVKIKAAGGIRTIEDALAYANAGCSRIGSSKVAPLIAAKYNL
ncbi:deoxyribose-phosphate aldolase [Butyrivibrio sp. Su6]|uniref:deoxyribose-phosphate aldolase n=1 Tax=unclassified Butyrivibrio TaxID=2639466 RepID=UPI0003B69885|nr:MULTISPECIES: deoxyribose-phosphate aldolase [unclassified Butyrivibrio]MBP3818368.1 deoxyribose-phosphate aldolase [Butyrivibrio sp.]MBQ9305468.1 deoxyribose-phosphate aldolase [Butyrivibrio sp.]SEF96161.1 deoxyribose-phosphate aldolase [Butyrivibrio sp. Su6]